MAKKSKSGYFKQKLALYFDENFPLEIVNDFKKDTFWQKKCRITSAFDKKARGKNDIFHFSYCKKYNFILVTLDEGFWNDTKYPFSKIPGVIIVTAKRNEISKIKHSLETLLSFLTYFPLPKYFVGDSKFKVSSETCVMKGKDAQTGEIKIYTITPGDSVRGVGKKFGWF